MSIGWINAAALWGLGLIAIPIAIHLLVRQHTRVVRYPSLRFVRETALAAFRRRAIEDALLLACRAGVVAAAVLALAGPILQTPARTESYADRVARAVVRLDDTGVDEAAAAGAFRTQTFRRAGAADALADAVRWLDGQPPASREIVVFGEFRKGQIAEGDLLMVPPHVGVRFAASPARSAPDQYTQTTLTRRDGRLVFARRSVELLADSTRVSIGEVVPAPPDLVRVIAPPPDQPLADAALNAALDAGLRWPNPERRLVVLWGTQTSAPETAADVVRMPVPSPPSRAATAIAELVEASAPGDAEEPITIPRADLDAWSRPSDGVPANAPPMDEGDRRWLWAVALALLAVEWRLRRERADSVRAQEERRVA
jgi:hypothetical protein